MWMVFHTINSSPQDPWFILITISQTVGTDNAMGPVYSHTPVTADHETVSVKHQRRTSVVPPRHGLQLLLCTLAPEAPTSRSPQIQTLPNPVTPTQTINAHVSLDVPSKQDIVSSVRCCVNTWISPAMTVVAAATCTLYESRAVMSTSAVTLVPFIMRKFSSGASLSVTLPTMMLIMVNVPYHKSNTCYYRCCYGHCILVSFSTYQWRYDVMFQRRSRLMLDRGTSRGQIQEARKPTTNMPYLWKTRVFLSLQLFSRYPSFTGKFRLWLSPDRLWIFVQRGNGIKLNLHIRFLLYETELKLFCDFVDLLKRDVIPWGRCIMPTLMPEMRSGMP